MQRPPVITVSFNHQLVPPPTIGTDEIARLVGLQPATFQRRRHQLIAAGMPRPIAGFDQRWSRAAIMAWIDGTPALAGSAHQVEDGVDRHRAYLEGKMGGAR